MRTRSKFGIALIIPAVSLMAIVTGCVVYRDLSDITTKDLHVEKPVKELATAYPEQFNKPFTLLVLTDESATCGMTEARWWRDWEAYMNQRGWGFLLATSPEDSLDLVIAAELDSVKARTLVVPSCRQLLRELGIPFVPLNLLVDSTGDVHYARTAVMDSAASRMFMDTLVAVVARSVKH